MSRARNLRRITVPFRFIRPFGGSTWAPNLSSHKSSSINVFKMGPGDGCFLNSSQGGSTVGWELPCYNFPIIILWFLVLGSPVLPFSDKQLLLVQLLPLPGSHPGFPLPLLPAEFLVPKGMGLFLFMVTTTPSVSSQRPRESAVSLPHLSFALPKERVSSWQGKQDLWQTSWAAVPALWPAASLRVSSFNVLALSTPSFLLVCFVSWHDFFHSPTEALGLLQDPA